VNVIIEGAYSVRPQSLEQCINYEKIYQLVTQEWPRRPHVILLESYITELLEYTFRSDERVTYVKASIAKPDIFPDAESIGVEAEWTRKDFERLKN
jgi:dihydroneopterin aldolase